MHVRVHGGEATILRCAAGGVLGLIDLWPAFSSSPLTAWSGMVALSRTPHGPASRLPVDAHAAQRHRMRIQRRRPFPPYFHNLGVPAPSTHRPTYPTPTPLVTPPVSRRRTFSRRRDSKLRLLDVPSSLLRSNSRPTSPSPVHIRYAGLRPVSVRSSSPSSSTHPARSVSLLISTRISCRPWMLTAPLSA